MLVRYAGMSSSVIRSFAYDSASATLDVIFVSGRRYRYFLVPAYVAEGLSEALSKGRYFGARVRDRFPCEELATVTPQPASAAISRRKGSRPRP